MAASWNQYIYGEIIKYFSLLHAGIVNLTDVGCIFRIVRKEGLERVISELTFVNSDKTKAEMAAPIHLTLEGIKNDLRILEIPVTTYNPTNKENFLHVEFTSKIFRFVDDVEFYFNAPGIIHFRSASRIGHSDMGVNRHRMEEIRHLFTKGFLNK